MTPIDRTPASAVDVRGLSTRYGERLVLDGLDLEIPAGQRVAVLGPNGAGKSTLIEILEGIRRPSSGELAVLGVDPATAPESWKSRIGVVLQSWRDHGAWRVEDLLAYIAAAHRSAGRTELWDVGELLGAVGLAEQARQRLRPLSGGQRRRIDVAAALLGCPELLFLYEPTTGFDPVVRRDFHRLMNSLAPGTTIVWATHDLQEAQKMCDRILILNGGRITADGSPEGLRTAMSSETTVTWRTGAGPQGRRLAEPRELIAELAVDPDVDDLEVRRGSLEDAYLAIVTAAEGGEPIETVAEVELGTAVRA